MGFLVIEDQLAVIYGCLVQRAVDYNLSFKKTICISTVEKQTW